MGSEQDLDVVWVHVWRSDLATFKILESWDVSKFGLTVQPVV